MRLISAVYANVLDGWLGADSISILGGDFRSGALAIAWACESYRFP